MVVLKKLLTQQTMYMLTFGQSILDNLGRVHESIQDLQCCNLCIRQTVQSQQQWYQHIRCCNIIDTLLVLCHTRYYIQGTTLDRLAAVQTQVTEQQTEVTDALDFHT